MPDQKVEEADDSVVAPFVFRCHEVLGQKFSMLAIRTDTPVGQSYVKYKGLQIEANFGILARTYIGARTCRAVVTESRNEDAIKVRCM